LTKVETSLPLFLCPNDSETMKKVVRDGVEFDICPTCRGVWLDRGELEKLLSAERAEGGHDPQPVSHRPAAPPREASAPYPYREERRDYDDDDERRYRYKKKRGFDLFDIFD
jgi:hypothetical protein